MVLSVKNYERIYVMNFECDENYGMRRIFGIVCDVTSKELNISTRNTLFTQADSNKGGRSIALDSTTSSKQNLTLKKAH